MQNRTINRRVFLKGSAMALGVSALAACTVTPAGTDGGAPMPTAGVLWGLQYDHHIGAYERLSDLYLEKSGVELTVAPQPWPIETKLIAALSAGTQPEAACIMGKVLVPLHIQNALMPLRESVYNHNGLDVDEDFNGDSVEAYQWGDDIFGVPTEMNGVGNMVNVPVDEVEALGMADAFPPTNGESYFASYSSMWELAESLQIEEDGTVVRWGLSSKGWDAQSYLGIARSLLAAEGTDWWDNDNKNFNIDTDAGVQAMEMFVATPVAMGIETELDQNHVDAALAGKVAIARGNGTPMIEGHKHGYAYEITGAPMVTPPDLPMFVGEGGWGFVAPKQSKQPEVSMDFLRLVASLEGQTEYARIYGGAAHTAWSQLVGVYDHFEDSSDTSPAVKAAKLLQILATTTGYYGQGFGSPSSVDGAVAQVCSEVRQQNLTAAEGAAALQERLDAVYAQFQSDMSTYTPA